jgi:nucleotide-binding universal stress UspA family protein
MRTILIAVDESPPAAEAVAFGVELAVNDGVGVVFAHVVPAAGDAPVTAHSTASRSHPEKGGYDRSSLDAAVLYAAKRGVSAESKILVGDEVDEIVAYADSLDANLIVVGSRGAGAGTTSLLGSVSRGVLEEARRPVLVVHRVLAGVPRALAGDEVAAS